MIQYVEHSPEIDVLRLAQEGVTPDQVRLDRVEHSSADLAETQEWIWENAAPSLGAGGLASIAEDVESNGLVIAFGPGIDPGSHDVRAITRGLEERGVSYSIRVESAADDACTSRAACDAPQRAGVRIDRSGTYCSTGWTVNRSGVRFSLTAGHCWFSSNSGAATSGGAHFGPLNNVNTLSHGSHADLRLVAVSDSRPWVYHSNGTKNRVVSGLSNPVANGMACLFGAKLANGRCGSIISTSASKYSPTCNCTLYDMVTANYSLSIATSGGSGGAVANSTTGQLARGVHEGSSDSGLTRYFTAIGYVSQYGLGVVATG